MSPRLLMMICVQPSVSTTQVVTNRHHSPVSILGSRSSAVPTSGHRYIAAVTAEVTTNTASVSQGIRLVTLALVIDNMGQVIGQPPQDLAQPVGFQVERVHSVTIEREPVEPMLVPLVVSHEPRRGSVRPGLCRQLYAIEDAELVELLALAPVE